MDNGSRVQHPVGFRRRVTTAFMLAAAVLGAVVFLEFGSTASAATTSNFIATGHDMDFHCSGGDADECAYFNIVVTIVRNGSPLPILALDEGTQVPESLAAIGQGPVVTVDPSDAAALNATALTDAGGAPLYSAIIVASDATCSGCDNTLAGATNINARAADIRTFFNAGGGILALAGAENREVYYDFVPLPGLTAAAVSPPFTVTPQGAALGITDDMVNCCATHNSFALPPAPFVVFETDSEGLAETIAALNVVIDGGGFVTTTLPTTTTLPGATTTTLPGATTTTVDPGATTTTVDPGTTTTVSGDATTTTSPGGAALARTGTDGDVQIAWAAMALTLGGLLVMGATGVADGAEPPVGRGRTPPAGRQRSRRQVAHDVLREMRRFR